MTEQKSPGLQSSRNHGGQSLSIDLLGVQFVPLSQDELLQSIDEAVTEQRPKTVLSGNIHSFNLAYENDWFRDYFNQADAIRLDGAGIRLGARLLGYATPPRMTWADFAWVLAESASAKGHTLFFLGSRSGIAEEAADRLRAKFPNLHVVGTHHGYFDKTLGSTENEQVKNTINNASPDILVIGFGMPLQEHWLMQNRDDLSARVVLTGGAVFDYISGTSQRPPAWLTNYGFEWLGRLIIEPRRLWRRYVVGNPKFFWRLFKQQLGWAKPVDIP